MTGRNFLKRLSATAAIVAMASGSILVPLEGLAYSTTGIGNTSTGTVGIEVDKPAQAEISGMTDMVVGPYVIGDSLPTPFTTACIYSTSGAYTVDATGSGAAGAFTVTDGAGSGSLHVLPYTVTWNSAGVGAIGTGGAALTSGTTSAQLLNANIDSADCTTGVNPGANAQINIGLTTPDLVALASGTFTGTLTLLVSPD